MRKTLLFVISLILLAGSSIAVRHSGGAPDNQPAAVSHAEFGVGALGRIEPQSEVIQVNAPSVMEPPVVERLLVKVGDKVPAGEILAYLDNYQREVSDVEQAKAAMVLAEKSLAQVRAGAKAGEIEAQAALVETIQERLRLAEKQLERYRRLRDSHALSEEDLDVRVTEVDVLQRELRQQEAMLLAIREIRSVDVERAEADVLVKAAALQRAEADLEVALIRSPIDAEILRINSRAGERIGTDGLLDLGDTRQMDVVAEVHESDILKVEPGQSASVFLRNLNRRLQGTVVEVGRLVGRKDVLSNDPVDDTDARVVEVRIRLCEADGQEVSGMSWARVEVTIDTSSPKTPSPTMTLNEQTMTE